MFSAARPTSCRERFEGFAAGREREQAGQRAAIFFAKAADQVLDRRLASSGLCIRSTISGIVVPGPSDRSHAQCSSSLGTSSSGMMPPIITPTCSRPFSPQFVHQRRDERHVGAAQQADAQPVGVFVQGRLHDCFDRLPEAGIDHVKARIAQATSDDLHAAVVSVETDLRQHHPRRRRICGHDSPPDLVAGPTRPPRRTSFRRPSRGPCAASSNAGKTFCFRSAARFNCVEGRADGRIVAVLLGPRQVAELLLPRAFVDLQDVDRLSARLPRMRSRRR